MILRKKEPPLDFREPPMPPQCIQAEESVLGGILLDPDAIKIAERILIPDAFSITVYQVIYEAALAVHKQGKTTDLMNMVEFLSTHGLLEAVGGQNKLLWLLSITVSAINIDGLANLVMDKYLRRQLMGLGSEIIRTGHSRQDLNTILENVEEKVKALTGLRHCENNNQDSNGINYGYNFLQSQEDIIFKQLCEELDELEKIENSARRHWAMRTLAKKYGFRNEKDLLDFHTMWINSQSAPESLTVAEYFEKYGKAANNWLIKGFIPQNSINLLVAPGGVGKTRLVFSLALKILTGQPWGDYPTKRPPGKVLIIETDESQKITAILLDIQGFVALPTEIQANLEVLDEWDINQIGHLEKILKRFQPDLVIIDSLTSVSTSSIYKENDTEYARPLVAMRQLTKKYNCSFLILHHTNAQGKCRGTRAIFNTVDEVWRLEKKEPLNVDNFNLILTIDKSRSRAPGRYQLKFNDDYGIDIEGALTAENTVETEICPQVVRIMALLEAHPGVALSAEEIAEAIGLSVSATRLKLSRATNIGLIQRTRGKRYKGFVYFSGEYPTQQPEPPSDDDTEPPVPPRPPTPTPPPPPITESTDQGKEPTQPQSPDDTTTPVRRTDGSSTGSTPSGRTNNSDGSEEYSNSTQLKTSGEKDAGNGSTANDSNNLQPLPPPSITVGSRVRWLKCPGYLEGMQPFLVTAILGVSAHLEFMQGTVSIKDLIPF